MIGQEPDMIRWQWTESGIYSAKSCYLALFHGSTQAPHWKLTWKNGAPMGVKMYMACRFGHMLD